MGTMRLRWITSRCSQRGNFVDSSFGLRIIAAYGARERHVSEKLRIHVRLGLLSRPAPRAGASASRPKGLIRIEIDRGIGAFRLELLRTSTPLATCSSLRLRRWRVPWLHMRRIRDRPGQVLQWRKHRASERSCRCRLKRRYHSLVNYYSVRLILTAVFLLLL